MHPVRKRGPGRGRADPRTRAPREEAACSGSPPCGLRGLARPLVFALLVALAAPAGARRPANDGGPAAAAPAAVPDAPGTAEPSGAAVAAPGLRRVATVRVRPRAGIAFHDQLRTTAPVFGLSAEAAVTANGRLAVGLSAEHLRFDYRRTGVVLVADAWTDLETSFRVVPVLATVTVRLPLASFLEAHLGAGLGPFFTEVRTEGHGGTARVRPTTGQEITMGGAGIAGLGFGLGPGRITLEGRFNVASGEVDGAAKGLRAGGPSAQAGYELDL